MKKLHSNRKELLSNIFEFLGEIASSWIGIMSGIVGVTLWILGAVVEPASIPLRSSFLTFAFIALVIASFTGWLKKMPHFNGIIDQTIFSHNPNNLSSIKAIITMSIRNTGQPSIVDQWNVYIQLPDSSRINGRMEMIGRKELYEQSTLITTRSGQSSLVNPVRVITEQEALYNRGLRPIPTGGMIRGYLIATFSGIAMNNLTTNGGKIVVEFSDVWHRSFSCFHNLIGDAVPLGQADYFPIG